MNSVIGGVEYGPLAVLIGEWRGDKGVDLAPEPDGEERSSFYEKICYEACGGVDIAQQQTLAILRYHQVVSRKSNDEVFHNESGYWSYDAKTGVVMQSLAIPRGFALLAGGRAERKANGESVFTVEAIAGDKDWGIVESPFLRDNAHTKRFTHTIEVNGNDMSYRETTCLKIYGRSYDRIDVNRLSRV